MGDFLFNRRAQVIVGPVGGEGRIISDLRIQFEIDQNSEENSNRGKIKIYNLNRDSRGVTERANQFLILRAGYGDDTEVLYQGNVSKGITEKSGPDFITQFETGDGQDETSNSTVNKSFSGGVSMGQVFDEVVKAMGLPVKVEGLNRDEKFEQGVSISGASRDELSKLVEKQKLEWSIQNGEIIVRPIGAADEIEVFQFTASTGLLGIPKRTDKGVEAKVLLNPKIKPGSVIRVFSDVTGINGEFTTRKVLHIGDTRLGAWESKIEATLTDPLRSLEEAIELSNLGLLA